VPAFDRAGVDGFAVRAADIIGAGGRAPRRLLLNAEVIACGHPPALEVRAGTASTIATGGAVPRGADAVVMIEHTELIETPTGPAVEVRRAAAPGQFVAFAGSDMARGETVLRRGQLIGSREIGILAACGIADIPVVRRPKVAVLSTGDELVPPGAPLPPAGVYDSNGAIVAAAVEEAGGEAVRYGAFPDTAKLRSGCARLRVTWWLLSGTQGVASVLSDPLTRCRACSAWRRPAQAPLCLAVSDGKPIAVLPGFPTSAIFTFHAFVAPVIRARAGLPADAAQSVKATVPVRIASEMGRQEFVLTALVQGERGPVAFPIGKGSGSVTSFSQADGFVVIDALSAGLDAGSTKEVTLIGAAARAPDIVIMGSHCVALDIVIRRLAEQGFTARTVAVGSLGGIAAVERGECDLAPVHLLDPASGRYNSHLIRAGISLQPGWQRMQGFMFRAGDARFSGKTAADALHAALADSSCLMVNRNAGAGTRILIDQLLEGRRPPGYANQPKSHNAVAAAIAQGRADWGIAIANVAKLYGLAFLPIAPEHFDFLVVDRRRSRPAVQAFLAALAEPIVRKEIAALGMKFPECA
jgi:putative molybdopterin biosynthesis protein